MLFKQHGSRKKRQMQEKDYFPKQVWELELYSLWINKKRKKVIGNNRTKEYVTKV